VASFRGRNEKEERMYDTGRNVSLGFLDFAQRVMSRDFEALRFSAISAMIQGPNSPLEISVKKQFKVTKIEKKKKD